MMKKLSKIGASPFYKAYYFVFMGLVLLFHIFIICMATHSGQYFLACYAFAITFRTFILCLFLYLAFFTNIKSYTLEKIREYIKDKKGQAMFTINYSNWAISAEFSLCFFETSGNIETYILIMCISFLFVGFGIIFRLNDRLCMISEEFVGLRKKAPSLKNVIIIRAKDIVCIFMIMILKNNTADLIPEFKVFNIIFYTIYVSFVTLSIFMSAVMYISNLQTHLWKTRFISSIILLVYYLFIILTFMNLKTKSFPNVIIPLSTIHFIESINEDNNDHSGDNDDVCAYVFGGKRKVYIGRQKQKCSKGQEIHLKFKESKHGSNHLEEDYIKSILQKKEG